MQTFKATVAEHELLGGSFQYTHLELIEPRRIEFQAGQYIIVTIDPERGVRRNYSISSSPSMDHAIEFLVDINPAGEGSMYLASLSPGDHVEFTGPFGSFVVNDDERGTRESQTNQELLFIATGSGISPIRSMIVDQLVGKKRKRPIRLWWGMGHQEDCFWIEEFDELEREHPNFEWDLILSKPPEGWPLHSGYVTQHVLNYVQNRKDTLRFYLCGNQHMIVDLSTALEKVGINRDDIHQEKFF